MLLVTAPTFSMPPLSNPVNDALDVSEKLTSLRLVISGFDLDRGEMERKIREFFAGLSGSERFTLFYYAGHALQIAGQNYMAPVSASLASQDDLPFETIPLDMILSAMEREDDIEPYIFGCMP